MATAKCCNKNNHNNNSYNNKWILVEEFYLTYGYQTNCNLLEENLFRGSGCNVFHTVDRYKEEVSFGKDSVILWRRKWQPAPVFLPGKSHGQEEPGRLQSMGSQRVGHDWVTSLSLSNHLVLCHPLLPLIFPSIRKWKKDPASGSFSLSQLFTSGGQNIGASASASVLSVTIQDWFPVGWTGLISLQSRGLSKVFSNTSSKTSILWCLAFFIV